MTDTPFLLLSKTGCGMRRVASVAVMSAAFILAQVSGGMAQNVPPQGDAAQKDMHTGPLRLYVPKNADAAPQGAPLDQQKADQDQGQPASRGIKTVSGVQVNALADINPESLGLIDATNGGLPANIWAGSPQRLIVGLLNQIPVQSGSRAMGRLAQRLLLTAATPPQPAPGLESVPVLPARMQQLFRLGQTDKLLQLFEMVPDGLKTEPVQRLYAETLLLEQQDDQACGVAGRMLPISDHPFWQKLQIFCWLRDGGQAGLDKAILAESVLKESGDTDRNFYHLSGLISGRVKTSLSDMEPPQPLHLAMLRYTSRPAPAQLTDGQDAWVLKAAAQLKTLPLAARLQAAEKAEAAGVLDVKYVRALYAQVPISKSEQKNPLAINLATASGRAKVYKIAVGYKVESARAELLAHAIHTLSIMANNRYVFPMFARVIRAEVLEFRPSSEYAWFAGHAARTLMAAGAPGAAEDWARFLKAYSKVNAKAFTQAAVLWPLEKLSNPALISRHPDGYQGHLRTWREAVVSMAAQGDAQKVDADVLRKLAQHQALALSLYTALGEDIRWQDMLEVAHPENRPDGKPANSALLRLMDRAAAEVRVGETILLALVALGDEGPAGASPETLYRVIENLRFIGRDQDARAIALEAAIGKGL